MTTPDRSPDPWSDARLFELFAALPQWGPAGGFVDRVLASLPRRRWFESRWGRSALAAALVAVAFATALLVPTAVSVVRLAGPATILGYWSGAVADLFSGLAGSLVSWERIASFGHALGLALAQPKALLLLAANAAVALAAFRGLIAVTSRRSASHVVLAS